MTTAHNRVAVLHGVNFDVLERRDPEVYGGLSLDELERKIERLGARAGPGDDLLPDQLGGRVRRVPAPGCPSSPTRSLINAGAWTHYSRAIADALELTGLPAVEVHLSDVESREDWRRVSVFDGLVLEKVSGKGPDGYRDALATLARQLDVAGER